MGKMDAVLVARKMNASGLVKSATLTRQTAGTRTPGALSAGTNPTEASYTARGWVTTTRKQYIGGTLVQASDRVVALLGASIESSTVPAVGDKIAIESVTQRVVGVENDPGRAVYTCLCRGS